MGNMSNPLNTEFVQSIVGFTLDDVLKIEPFKDAYSTGWFVIFMTFIGAVLVLMGIALLYSLCDYVCSCCRRPTSSVQRQTPNTVQAKTSRESGADFF